MIVKGGIVKKFKNSSSTSRCLKRMQSNSHAEQNIKENIIIT